MPYRRTDVLLVDHVDLLPAVVQKVKATHRLQIDAKVMLPDHLHCLWTLPEADDFSTPWQN